MPGVVAYVDHTDIPGKNDATLDYPLSYEQIFTSGRVFYAGQAIGLILANSSEEAHRAARAVKVTYKDKQKPILTIQEALEKTPGHIMKDKKPIITGNIQGTVDTVITHQFFHSHNINQRIKNFGYHLKIITKLPIKKQFTS